MMYATLFAEFFIQVALIFIKFHKGRKLVNELKIIGWFGSEGALKDYLLQPPAMSRDIFHCVRLPPSNLSLNTFSDGILTSLGNMFQYIITLTVNNKTCLT